MSRSKGRAPQREIPGEHVGRTMVVRNRRGALASTTAPAVKAALLKARLRDEGLRERRLQALDEQVAATVPDPALRARLLEVLADPRFTPDVDPPALELVPDLTAEQMARIDRVKPAGRAHPERWTDEET